MAEFHAPRPISHSHPLPYADYTGSPAKKPKLEKHRDGQHGARKEKHSKHSKHDKVARTDGKSTVKKEPIPVMKRKPVISESDSEEDNIPLGAWRSQLHTVKEVKTEVKQESSASPINHHLPLEMRKSQLEGDIPLAQRKADLAKKPSLAVATTKHTGDSSKHKSKHHSGTPTRAHVPDSKPPKTVDGRTPKVTAAESRPVKVKPETPSPVKAGVKRKKSQTESDREYSDDEFKPKKPKKTPTSNRKITASPASSLKKKSPVKGSPAKGGASPATKSPAKRGRKKEEEKEVWKWWEEKPLPEGVKWLTLEHKGPYFAPPYEPLPDHVRFIYDGKTMDLSQGAEEAAGFFAKMLDHDYTTKDVFCKNFFQDWRKEMTAAEAAAIKDWKKCEFTQIHEYYKECSEVKKQMSKEEKAAIKAENEKILEEYGWAIVDGHRQRIGNFKTEPPGLFRGRGDHPKQGRIKRRIQAEDVIINIGKDAPIPEPPPDHHWRSVQHDNKVTWLASWTENIQGQIKYIMLNPTSKIKGEKDWAKYETARKLKDRVDKIRAQYREDWKSKEMKVRQRSVAVYFIDKLALRAGNEKDADESADTVGCCSLRVEHLKLHEELDGKENMVELDFLGKDSIRYYNRVQVERQVFKNLNLFMKDKVTGDDLFDRLTTTLLNKHLSELMEGLTAKVFRTYNASKTLQEQLVELTDSDDSQPSMLLSYNRANRAVAILCNHQRAPPKTFDQQMSNLQAKIQAKEEVIVEARSELKSLKKEARTTKDPKLVKKVESKKKAIERLEEQLQKLEVQATDKQENKEIALGTSKLNYLDPRISVAWCKKWDVPVEKVYNKSQREKFAWAIDMAGEDFIF